MEDDGVEGSVKRLVGECFVDTSADDATAFVAAALAEERATKERLEAELKTIAATQDVLKKRLYARFGRSINLEDK